jgi:hypothetical protein
MSDLRTEQLSLALGTVLGQLSELLNNIRTVPLSNEQIYKSLLDIVQASSLHVHELYYKDKK